mgnify:CR=1 FL=1|nr:XRE family transcriptional regulator [uncultured Acinetobacter sp.]
MTERNAKDADLIRVVGENCRRAREWCGMNRTDAMQSIFNYRDEKATNRICEIENGHKSVSVAVLYKMCLTYQCSADFLLGISNEIEPNLAASQNGLIVESMRSTGLEIADRISETLTKQMSYLPKFQGELLASSAKHVYQKVTKYSHDLAFTGSYPDLIDAASQLNSHIKAFEITVAKYMRFIEMNAMQVLDDFERDNLTVTRDRKEKPNAASLLSND